jgi:hypothetical protein
MFWLSNSGGRPAEDEGEEDEACAAFDRERHTRPVFGSAKKSSAPTPGDTQNSPVFVREVFFVI